MPDLNTDQRAALIGVYEEAKAIGLLGPGPVESHIDHGTVFIEPLRGLSGPVLDLGSGGGVPGLLLALISDQPFYLLDAMVKRCTFLRKAVMDLGLQDRCFVLEGRAEDIARSEHREQFAAVTSRSFAPPAVTAECSVGFLREGGLLIVSEPPGDEDRWPAAGIAQLGLERLDSASDVAVMRRIGDLSERYPRRPGIPEKRPLF